MTYLFEMNHSVIFATIVVYISLQFVYGITVSNTGPSFQIRDGNCSAAVVGDLVFQDHSHKLPIPFTTREDTSHWAGDQKIYCVIASSKQDPSENSTVEITEGGVNHTFVTLKMKSIRSHGFEYDIQVFGK